MIQMQADVFVYSDGLTEGEINKSLFLPCQDIPETLKFLKAKYGQDASIAVLPEGPQTIPYLSNA
jgi:hypothetical protein